MATMNEYLEKALDGVRLDEKAGDFYANVNFEIKLTGVKNKNEAMKRAQRFVNDVESKFNLFDALGTIESVEGPSKK